MIWYNVLNAITHKLKKTEDVPWINTPKGCFTTILSHANFCFARTPHGPTLYISIYTSTQMTDFS